jgi:hypothetical protein
MDEQTTPTPQRGRQLTDERVAHLRAQLPVLERGPYLNAGTLGPLPLRAIQAMREQLELEALDRHRSTGWRRARQLPA